ncbi:MAG: hypothetical protein AAF458_00945 [Pseudomonadota bacterium]
MYLSIERHDNGVRCERDTDIIYDLAAGEAKFGTGATRGPSLRWRLGGAGEPTALLARLVDLTSAHDWIVRCDRVDFPPGSVAYRHTHPGPGIRCTLFGSLTIESNDSVSSYGPMEPWFEAGPEPVRATADADNASAFVRVMLLPAQWAGRRTITYVDPADADRPKLQRPTVFFDRRIELRA